MIHFKFQIPNPKPKINSKIQITKTQKTLPSPGGRGWRGGGKIHAHPHLHPVEYISLLHRASPLPSRERGKYIISFVCVG
jgi:hypothetical protein